MNNIPKYSSSAAGGAGSLDPHKVVVSGAPLGRLTRTDSTDSMHSTASDVSDAVAETFVELNRKGSGAGAGAIDPANVAHLSGDPSVKFELDSDEEVVIGNEGLNGNVRPRKVDQEFQDAAKDCLTKIKEKFRDKYADFDALKVSVEDRKYWWYDAAGNEHEGIFTDPDVWSKDEFDEIDAMLDEIQFMSTERNLSSGVPSVDYKYGSRSLGQHNEPMKKGFTNLTSYRGSLATPEAYASMKADLEGKAKQALLDEKAIDAAKYDANLTAVLHNYALLKKSTEDKIAAIKADQSITNEDDRNKKLFPLQRYLEEIEKMDLFAIAAAASVKGKQTKAEQVQAAIKLRDALYVQNKKSSPWKIMEFGRTLFGGTPVLSNRDSFIYAAQVAAQTITDPLTRDKFLRESLAGGSGTTLQKILEDEHGFFTSEATRKYEAEEEVQRYTKFGIAAPETKAELILLEPDEDKASEQIDKHMAECGIDDADRAELINTMQNGITASNPQDSLTAWAPPTLSA